MSGAGARLKLVPPEDPAPVDIAAQLRADIQKRDWGRVHIEGDRNPPIALSTARQGRWRS
jgi:hypothetical protein